MNRRDALRALFAASLSGCGRSSGKGDEPPRPAGKLRIVFKHQPLWGDPAPFRELLADFERQSGDVEVVTEPLPNASDVVHQFFLTALEGGARDFDVFIADVVWVAELARAGWIADLSSAFPPDAIRKEFLPGAAQAAIVDQKTWAVPWYVDTGVLYRRTDLLPSPPLTYDELAESALSAVRGGAVDQGYVWQGRQYEGLVCNVYETLWGFGGETMRGGRVLLDTPEARGALSYMRRLLASGASPASVTSQAEEESRRSFQSGRAALMRNWPYAYAEAQKEGSPVRGKVAVSALPSVSGAAGHGTLGGYLLALNARSHAYKRERALQLMAHLSSADANVRLALNYGRNPARRAPYEDPRVQQGASVIAGLLPVIERARPRPVTPYYPMISEVLQGEFSAAISGIRSPEEALSRAQALVDHLTGERP
ncbi:MAG: ABC transporter substrate-binding protein [Polyangiaceae bacterium]